MASVSSPYGLEVISNQEGFAIRTLRIPNGITSGYGTNIFRGAPVTINPATGTIQAVTATNQALYGVMAGVEFTPLGGRPAESPFWPAGTVVDPTYDFLVYIVPFINGSNQRIKVQANGPVNQISYGAQFNITNFTAGNTATGLSACQVAATPIVAGQTGQLAFVEFFDTSGIYGVPGDAFTDLICVPTLTQIDSNVPSIG